MAIGTAAGGRLRGLAQEPLELGLPDDVGHNPTCPAACREPLSPRERLTRKALLGY